MRPVLAVTGTRREAAVLRGLGVTAIAGGGDAAALARELAQTAKGAAGIVSFGMAGALNPDLRVGDWVIGARLTGSWEGQCDEGWGQALAAALPAARLGPVFADGRLIADPAEKLALGRQGALAADMESHIAAAAAEAVGAPFAILRCISDEAGAAMPPAVAVAMKPGGGLATGAIFNSILRNPAQLPELLRATARFNRAFAALRDGSEAAGPRLAFDRR